MKKHVSVVFGTCLGACAGFTLCYLCLVLPHREDKPPTPEQVRQQEKTAIRIARDGSLYLAEERVDLTQLAGRIEALGARQAVTIRADRSTHYKRVVEVLDVCKTAAVSGVSIVAATTQ